MLKISNLKKVFLGEEKTLKGRKNKERNRHFLKWGKKKVQSITGDNFEFGTSAEVGATSLTSEIEKSIFSKVNFETGESGFYGIVGEKGVGKTTLLNVICGEQSIDDGTVMIDDDTLANCTNKEIEKIVNKKISYVRDEDNLIGCLTVGENMLLSVKIKGKAQRSSAILEQLERVEMRCNERRKVADLNLDQQKRCAIAAAMLRNAKMILLDEPDKGLQEYERDRLYEILRIIAKDVVVIVTTENEQALSLYADYVGKLADGELVMIKNPLKREPLERNESREECECEVENACENVVLENVTHSEICRDGAIIDSENVVINENVVDKCESVDTIKSGEEQNEKTIKNIAVESREYMSFRSNVKVASSIMLKAKGVVLATIVTFILAVTSMGLFFGALSFAISDSAQMGIYKKSGQELVLSKKDSSGKIEYFTNDEMAKIKKNDYNSSLAPIYYSGGNISSIAGLNIRTNKYYMMPNGFTTINDKIMANAKFTIYKGRMPKENNEIALPKYVAEGILQDSAYCSARNIVTIDDLLEKEIKTMSMTGMNFTVTGIIDTGVTAYYAEVEKAVQRNGGENNEDTLKKVWKTALDVSIHISLIMNENFFAEVYPFMPRNNLNFSTKEKDGFNSSLQMYSYSYAKSVGNDKIYLPTGKTSIEKGEIIISLNSLKNVLRLGYNYSPAELENIDKIKSILDGEIYLYNLLMDGKSLDGKYKIVGYWEANVTYGSAVLCDGDFLSLATGNGVLAYSTFPNSNNAVDVAKSVLRINSVVPLSYMKGDIGIAKENAIIIAAICGIVFLLSLVPVVALNVLFIAKSSKLSNDYYRKMSGLGLGATATGILRFTRMQICVIIVFLVAAILTTGIAALLSLVGTSATLLVSPIAISAKIFFVMLLMSESVAIPTQLG